MKAMAAYFSATGTTAYPACTLADAAGTDLMEIQPKAHTCGRI